MLTSVRAADATSSRPVSFPHRPGLDGLRALAVIGVLLFHAGFGWAVGGYLGVSAFFTLSGFLITTLLLTEHARTGDVNLPAFWIRRVRRLLPAALLGIAAGVGYVLVFGDSVAIDRVRADALAALAYVANWRFIFSGQSYAELFSGDSPLQHLWSLAIEEQFYLVLPLVAVFAFRRSRPTRALATFATVGLAGSIVVSLLLHGEADRLYYGTDTRAAELLVGVLLACLHHQRDLGARLGRQRDRLGALALAGIVVLWAVADQSWSLLHPWGLLLHAVLTATVVAAAIGEGSMARGLATPPLVWLGRISYGVYLFHWPIYLWLDEQRTGLSDGPLLALRLAVTLAVSVASFRLVESPIRYGWRRRPRREARRTVLALAVAAVLVVVSTAAVRRGPLIDFDAAQVAMDSLTTSTTVPDGTPSTTTSVPDGSPVAATGGADIPARPRVAIFGDSTALLFVPGLLEWSKRTGRFDLVEGFAVSGCELTRDGVQVYGGREDTLEPGCRFSDVWPPVLERGQPDIALVEIGLWDIVDRKIPGDDRVMSVGDPVYDGYFLSEADAAVDLLLQQVKRVVWVLQPPPAHSARADDDPVFERVAHLNQMLVDHFADRRDVVLVDVAAWLASTPDGTDSLRLRPDGTHFSETTSSELAAWLGPAILRAVHLPPGSDGVVEPGDVTTSSP